VEPSETSQRTEIPLLRNGKIVFPPTLRNYFALPLKSIDGGEVRKRPLAGTLRGALVDITWDPPRPLRQFPRPRPPHPRQRPLGVST